MSPAVYLDHAASTPLRASARAAVTDELARVGNASSLHAAGRSARAVVEESREALAAAFGAHPSEVLFTSGGTEADNLAIEGLFRSRIAADPARRRILVSAIEHDAVLETVEHLVATAGAEAIWLQPTAAGVITAESVRAALADAPESVALVSVMWANNETGVIQPIPEIVAVADSCGVPVHSDAVQAAGHIPIDFASSGLALMAVTAHKLGGPVGAGALLARRDIELAPISHGGGQERDVRSGTLNVAGARGFAVAATEAVQTLADDSDRLIALRDKLIRGTQAIDDRVLVTGAWVEGDGVVRLPGTAHFRFPDCDGEALLFLLDSAGVACSTGSACRAGVSRHSHVLTAMGIPDGPDAALRVTLGHTSGEADVAAFLAALPGAIAGARKALAVAR